jgi:hypothetical protein
MILSRVRDSVTNYCGLLASIVGFIGRYFTFTLNYNSSDTFCVLSYFTSELLASLRNPSLTSVLRLTSALRQSQSQSHIATDGQSVSKSWCRAPIWAHDQIFITVWHLRSCYCGAPSLTRGQVCLLHMLLALSSAVFLGSQSLGTHDHILLSQISDFPFRRSVLRQSQSHIATDGQSVSQ